MIKPIMKDPLFLAKKSSDATASDIPDALNLLETLSAHSDECVGMAANMIGVSKKIIVFWDEADGCNKLMFNPVITAKSGEYETEEGCLSLPGVRKTKRFKMITVQYQDMKFKSCKESYIGFTAQIIQHEIDMTNGILI